MRTRIMLPFLAAAILGWPAAASAAFPHVVAPGESLTSVAASDGLTVGQLAAANGLSPDAQLISGSTLMIPPQQGGLGSVAASGASSSVGASDENGTTSAGGGYVVQPGDTLSAIAARAGISVAQLAGDNGVDPNGILLSGSTIQVPGAGSGTAAPGSTSVGSSTSSGAYVVQPGDTLTAIAARAGTSVAQLAVNNGLDPNGILLSGSSIHVPGASGTAVPVSTSAGGSSGGYLVQPGDTLLAIAARAGISVPQLAADNGLDPNGTLLAGSTLMLPGAAAPSSSAAGQPVGTVAEGNPTAPPYPTPERVSASQVGAIANANGVPSSLAEAIGWQESGFNNDLVSTADARGVMQILPGTWDWIQRTLTAGVPLAPASAASNVRGGVLLLHSLLNSTAGNSALAAAGYYQGLSSVQQNGEFPDTQRYVRSVMALEQQFGGG
jgi:LysM repeat protein